MPHRGALRISIFNMLVPIFTDLTCGRTQSFFPGFYCQKKKKRNVVITVTLIFKRRLSGRHPEMCNLKGYLKWSLEGFFFDKKNPSDEFYMFFLDANHALVRFFGVQTSENGSFN